jgi:heptose-I-phosphate ethanolaminephosphotransferase
LTAAGYFLLMHFASKLSCRHKKYCRGDVFILLLIAVVLLIPLVKIRCSSGGETAAEIFRSHPFAGICRQIALFNEHAGEFTVEMRHRTPPENVSLAPAFQSDHPVGILVIGESAIRGHHSIYGYSRETTPALSAEKENIVLFDDVITVLPMTVTALKYFLTDMTLENRHLSWTLFDALKQAGYRIDVITNQNKSGWADSPLQMIFASADSVTYMHEENFSDLKEDAGAEVYDELLLPEAAQRLAEIRESRDDRRPRLVVIHLFGNHEPYASRYPEDFSRKFLDDRSYPQLVNEYDTGILYTDMILGKLLAGLKQIDRPGYLIYFSDHGSVCDPENLRTPGSVNNSAYEIPFLVWTNECYRRSMPELMARMERRRSVPLQADMAHYGLLEIMGVDFAAETGKHNFLSDGFAAPERTVLEGKKPYRKGGGNE